ncbi:MAG: sensor histidine kinase, partial [Chloroflexota bacterium]
YGLSFFTMGLAVFLESYHTRTELNFSRALRPLAGFGIVHGGHEWFEMFMLIYPDFAKDPDHTWINPLRLLLLASSFIMLVSFGARLIIPPARSGHRRRLMGMVAAIWLAGLALAAGTLPAGSQRWVASDVYTRYSLAIPGAALAVWGLILQRRRFIEMDMPIFGKDVVVAALAFGLYGGVGQLFASPSSFFPATVFNAESFVRWFGFPVQGLRAAMATMAAISIIRSLRSFEEQDRRRIDSLREGRLNERRRLEATRAELLHRTVKAQESERQRIARELHDETGQTLTALGMGLRALSDSIVNHPERAIPQVKHLESVANNGIEELQRLVGGLHPPQLDDLGLVAALRWYAGEVKKNFALPVKVSVEGAPVDLPMEQRVVFFRIAQEAITNAVRHAQAGEIQIQLAFQPLGIEMKIMDNGRGFDVGAVMNPAAARPCWGLLGIQERAALIGAACQIQSAPGRGSCIQVDVRYKDDSYV